MKVQLNKSLRRFELLILRPLSIAFPIVVIVCLINTSWTLAITMFVCWFFIGMIGQSLPHRKYESVSELSNGETLSSYDMELSHDDAYALAKAVMRTAILVGFVAFVVGWKMGLHWYWFFLLAFSGYAFVVLFAALLSVGKRSMRRSNSGERYLTLSEEQQEQSLREFERLRQPTERPAAATTSAAEVMKTEQDRQYEEEFDRSAEKLMRDIEALGPHAVHVNLGPNDPRAQALHKASEDLANRKHEKEFDQIAAKHIREMPPLKPGEYHVNLGKNDPRLKVMNEVLREQARRKVN